MINLVLAAGELAWSEVGDVAERLAERHVDATMSLRRKVARAGLPTIVDAVWRSDDGELRLRADEDPDGRAMWKRALGDCEFGDDPGPGWLRVLSRPGGELPCVVRDAVERRLDALAKLASSPLVRGLGQAAGVLSGGWADQLGGPSVLSGALAGGLLGSGLGYGLGWAGERLLPQGWRRGRLRRSLAMLGGLAGATPSSLALLDNLRAGRHWNSGDLWAGDDASFDSPHLPLPGSKQALYEGSGSSLAGPPVIPVDHFASTVMYDPRVAPLLSPATRGAATGLMQTAWAARGGGPRLVTPFDVARISAGMGSGYLSGLLVGKALGGLMGMPEPAQERLKQTGLWAGVVANMVPLAFGAR